MKEKNMSKAELARASGVHHTLIGRYLDGEVDIGEKNAPKIAHALGLEPGDVLWGKRAA
jgi:transcriptional regulator with XRE-family HTH domain